MKNKFIKYRNKNSKLNLYKIINKKLNNNLQKKNKKYLL